MCIHEGDVHIFLCSIVSRSGLDKDYSQKHQLLTDLVEQIDSLQAEKVEQTQLLAEKKRMTSGNVAPIPSTSGTQKVKTYTTMDV